MQIQLTREAGTALRTGGVNTSKGRLKTQGEDGEVVSASGNHCHALMRRAFEEVAAARDVMVEMARSTQEFSCRIYNVANLTVLHDVFW